MGGIFARPVVDLSQEEVGDEEDNVGSAENVSLRKVRVVVRPLVLPSPDGGLQTMETEFEVDPTRARSSFSGGDIQLFFNAWPSTSIRWLADQQTDPVEATVLRQRADAMDAKIRRVKDAIPSTVRLSVGDSDVLLKMTSRSAVGKSILGRDVLDHVDVFAYNSTLTFQPKPFRANVGNNN